jgi:hypothetical protein
MTTAHDDQTRLDDDPRTTPPASAAAVPVDLDLDQSSASDKRAQLPSFTIRLGGETWTIEPPDGGLVMELEEAGTTRATLALIFDDQWTEVSPLLDKLDPDDLTKLVRQYARHFEIDPQTVATQSAPNRSERRRLRKQQRR